jgi:hypothetical protein
MVNLGGTALLKCSVSSRHGDVQWIHDGTALGYDRKIPGKPRPSCRRRKYLRTKKIF